MNKKFWKNTLSLFSGTLSGQLLIILSSPILTRIYTLEEFGQLAVFTSILSIFLHALSFRYEMAFINIESENSKLELFKVIIVLILLTSTILVTILLTLNFLSIISYFKSFMIYFLLWVSLIGIGLYNALNHYALSVDRINNISISKFQQATSLVIIQLLGGLLNIKNGLIIGDSISRLSGIMILQKSLKKSDFKQIAQADFKNIKILLRKYSDYPKFSMISGMTNNFVMQSLPLVLSVFYAQPLIGILSLVQRVMVVPIKLVSQSIRQAYISEIMSHIQKRKYKRIKVMIFRIILLLALISILPAMIMWVYGEMILVFALGSNLEGSAQVIRALLILSVFQFIFLPISQTLEFLERQKIQFYWQIIRFIVVLLSLVILPKLGFSFSLVLYFYVIIMSLFYVILWRLIVNQLKTNIT